MNLAIFHNILTWFIASVWLINGVYCKLLNFVPRHQMIVARILGTEHAGLLTKAIGLSEICMAFWVLSGYAARWCVLTQIVVVATMNAIEFFLAPDLLLFKRLNAVFALMFIALVYFNSVIS